jgi:Domain of unknown function (DUF4412)
MKRCLMTSIAVVLCLAPLGADVTFTQTMTIAGGAAAAMVDGKPPMTTVMRIKGTKVRGDMDMMEMKISTLTDLSTKETILLNHSEKTAQLVTPASAAAGAATVPPMDVDVTFTPTGQKRAIEGVECAEHAFKMSVGMAEVTGHQAPKEGKPQTPNETLEMMKDVRVLMDGSTWIAQSGPAAAEYIAFQKAAAEASVAVFGAMLSGQPSTGGLDKLLAAVSEAPGLPYLTEMTMSVEGTGAFVEMVKPMIAGMKVTQKTTAVSTEPLPDDLFKAPSEYTIKR